MQTELTKASVKTVLKSILLVLISTFVLLFCLESVFFLAGFPQGASRFVETILIKNNLPVKKPMEFRIFTYGESTMYGAHYADFSSPALWLDKYLSEFLPGKSIRVINFARLGCNSHFVLNSVKETLAYRPDLMIFYIGHNSFLPKNTKLEIDAKEHLISTVIGDGMQKSRFFSEIYRQFLRFKLKHKTQQDHHSEDSPEQIETEPWTIAGQAVISRMDNRYSDNLNYLENNLLQIIDLAKKNHIPVIFFRPVCNLKDFAPTYSIHMKQMTEQELAKWSAFYQKGMEEADKNHLRIAEKNFSQAYQIDSTYADLCYQLGRLEFMKKNYAKARKFFEEARDNDSKINRATGDILSIFEKISKNEQIIMLDTEDILKGEVEGGILGEPIVEDNVHFSIKGHYLLGRALANTISNHDWIAPKREWRFEREKSYEELLQEFGVDAQKLIPAYLGSIKYFGPRFDYRIRVAHKILDLDPDNVQALRHLAWAYWLKGDTDEALKTYERLAVVDPQSLLEVFRLRPKIKRAFSRFKTPVLIGSLNSP